jgi:PIN domain nuclease of toxin-antitoxin system
MGGKVTVRRRRGRSKREGRVAESVRTPVRASTLLLDSHAFLWFVTGSERMSPAARRAIENQAATVFVSAASVWEIGIKRQLGKLPASARFPTRLSGYLRTRGFTELPITADHAEAAAALLRHHRDPFDCMLVAQARIEDLALVSNEALLDAYGIRRLW